MQTLYGQILARHHNLGLCTATFTYKNRNSNWQNQAVEDENIEKEEEDNKEDWRNNISRSSQNTKLTTIFDSSLESFSSRDRLGTGMLEFVYAFWVAKFLVNSITSPA